MSLLDNYTKLLHVYFVFFIYKSEAQYRLSDARASVWAPWGPGWGSPAGREGGCSPLSESESYPAVQSCDSAGPAGPEARRAAPALVPSWRPQHTASVTSSQSTNPSHRYASGSWVKGTRLAAGMIGAVFFYQLKLVGRRQQFVLSLQSREWKAASGLL